MPTHHGYFAKTCLCGSDNLNIFTSVRCMDCGRRTYMYRIGETQQEIRQACADWNKDELWDDEKEKAYREDYNKRFMQIMDAKGVKS